jgi:hypothetical protein
LGKTVLLVVGSTTLSASDAALKRRLETYYQTTVRDDGATADLTKDAIVVSGSVVASTLGTKYKATTKGVVVLAPAVLPAMAMAGAVGTLAAQTQIRIVTAGTTLVGGLAGNSLATVYRSGGSVGWATPAATALKAAVVANGNAARVTIFRHLKGAAMVGGYIAPGRRVGYYLQAADLLTADGWRLFDNAVAQAANLTAVPLPMPAGGPYAAASTTVAFDWSTFRRHGAGSDNWPTTWAEDDTVYSAWGDGSGAGPSYDPKYRVSMGLAAMSGNSAGSLVPRNLVGGRNPTLAKCLPNIGVRVDLNTAGPCYRVGLSGKTWGMLALNDYLYAWVSPGSWTHHYAEQRLFRARIGTNSWVTANWAFKPGDAYPLLNPTFLQVGRNAADSDGYLYAYAPRLAPTDPNSLSIQKRNGVGEIALLRVRKSADPMVRANWQYYAGNSQWSANIANAHPVITDRNGVGWNVSAIYVKARGRFYVAYEHTTSHAGYLSILESTNPQGPWKTVYYGRLANTELDVPYTGFY